MKNNQENVGLTVLTNSAVQQNALAPATQQTTDFLAAVRYRTQARAYKPYQLTSRLRFTTSVTVRFQNNTA